MTRSTNMEHVEVLRDLRDLSRAAIKAGDWKVDGACDPDAVLRRADSAIAALSAPQPPAEAHPDHCANHKRHVWGCRPCEEAAGKFNETAEAQENWKQCAEKAEKWWGEVCDALSEVDPDWMLDGPGGIESAVAMIRKLAARPAEAQGGGEASEGWHAALDSASELVSNAPDARYRKRAEQVRDWIKAHPAEAQPVAWSTDKPKRPGVYGVRGFNLCRGPEEQFEAIVSVRLYQGDLICNLHESTSEDDFDRWAPIEDCHDGFEWCEFVPANLPPSAPVGVEVVRRVAENIRANLDSLPSIARVWADDLDQALAQQPAAVDEAMVERALNARCSGYDVACYIDEKADGRGVIRAALTAALAAQQGGSDNDR